jgi:hypothetical protein
MAGGTLTVIQFALAGFSAFAEANGGHDSYGAHETMGTVIGVVSLLVLVAALLARPNRATIGQAVGLFLLAGPIQPILANLGRHTASWIGALHAVVGLAIMGLFGILSRRTTWGVGRS